MSFILDALKKSESDRQRQNGPALFEVRVAPRRARFPLWAVAIALLLAVNLGIVLYLLLRHPAHEVAVAAAPPAAAPLPAPVSPPPVGVAPPVAAVTAPAAVPATAPAVAPSTSPPPATPSTPAPAPPTAARAADSAAMGTAGAEDSNPADYAPAEEPAPAQLNGHVRRGTAAGVPLYQDAATVPGTQIPQLRLDLHVFSARVEDRFVMINMHKVHEGDTLPEGVHVDSITPEGAVLSYNGSRFLLPRE
jgi:general secretion pathway protein B